MPAPKTLTQLLTELKDMGWDAAKASVFRWTRAATIVAIAIAALGFGSAAAQSQSGWRETRTIDQMDGIIQLQLSRAAAAPIRDSIGRSGNARVVVTCRRAPNRRGIVGVYLTMPSELFVSFGDNRARLRIDDGEVQETYWDPIGNRRGLRARWPEMIFDLREASSLHVELAPPLSSRQYMQFDMSGARAAIERVLEACTLRDAELEAYNVWALQQLEALWDANLSITEPAPMSEYSYVYVGLQRVGAISGPPLGPDRSVHVGPDDFRRSGDRPLPPETVRRALMEYMRSSGRCIYPTGIGSTEEIHCPLNMPTRQAAMFFRVGDERIEPNVQWTLR